MSIDRQRYAVVREFGLQLRWGPVLGAVLLTALPDGLLKRRPTGLGLRVFGWQAVPMRKLAQRTGAASARLPTLASRPSAAE